MSKALFVNVPYIKYINGEMHTGPNAGSRWPWIGRGSSFHDYACFPFQMALAAQFLKLKGGVEVGLYDAVACKHNSYDTVKGVIAGNNPKYLIAEISSPLLHEILTILKWAKDTLNTINIAVGPHVYNNEDSLLKNTYIDYCITGEYDKPVYNIITALEDNKKVDRIHRFQFINDINLIDGKNFTPLRIYENLASYNDPSISAGRVQLQVSTSRGCPFRCIYCQWPKVFNDRTYRARNAELVADEIIEVKKEMMSRGQPIRSIFFDDDTWNVGRSRVEKLCGLLKGIELPWSMMGRADILPLDVYDKMVDSGCIGMRFGVETFFQPSLDAIQKKMDAKKNYESLKYILGRFSGLEFHFTTMRKLPYSTAQSISEDCALLNELKAVGEKKGNRIHWQISECIAYPGTDLFEWVEDHYPNDFDFTNPNISIPGTKEYSEFSAKWGTL